LGFYSEQKVKLWDQVSQFVRRPQGVWARKALFQVHLWVGIGAGLYILIISLSGSAIVFRREIAMALWQRPAVTPSGPLMSEAQLSAAAAKLYPRLTVISITIDNPKRAAIVVMARSASAGERRRERIFDPYTGKDLGAVSPDEPRFLSWLVSLHDDLLAEHTGRAVNGIGAILLLVLCVTGAVIWWQGSSRWARGLTIRWSAGWPRFNWDLHSALGFWMFLLVLMWAVTGSYLSFPSQWTAVLDAIHPPVHNSPEQSFADAITAWLSRIHFGRAYGTTVKWLYTILGLAPAALFITGAIMWWNRVLRKKLIQPDDAEKADSRTNR
jgi:uncharacterized iron-regulated membrane protein